MTQLSSLLAVAAFICIGAATSSSAQQTNTDIDVASVQRACLSAPTNCALRLSRLLASLVEQPAEVTDLVVGQVSAIAIQVSQTDPSLREALGDIVAQAAEQSSDAAQQASLRQLYVDLADPRKPIADLVLTPIAGSPS